MARQARVTVGEGLRFAWARRLSVSMGSLVMLALLTGSEPGVATAADPSLAEALSAPDRAWPAPAAMLASAGLKESVTPRTSQGGPSVCPADMIEVVGDYCPSVEQKCLRWLDPKANPPLRCAEFAESKCKSATVKKHFCIDKYEYPNQAGEIPVVMATWYAAQNACKAQGKRLCGSSEWTLACEGEERLPYAYGHQRNAEACNIDKPHYQVNERALASAATRDAEVARLDQRVPSGSMASCVSPYGVHDMVGNVDEWVLNEARKPYNSGSKGGYWGPVRTRCRPMTVVHNEGFSFYQLGFRCCADPGAYEGVADATFGTSGSSEPLELRSVGPLSHSAQTQPDSAAETVEEPGS